MSKNKKGDLSKQNILKYIVNFVPIILLYVLVTYTPEFVKFSHSILGKAFAVILILFYVKIDFVLGLFVCALVVFYYQTDYVESFNNMLNEGFTENVKGEDNSESKGEGEDEDVSKGKGNDKKDKTGKKDKTDKKNKSFQGRNKEQRKPKVSHCKS